MNVQKFYDESYLWLISRGTRVIAGLIIFLIGVWIIKFIRSRLRKRLDKIKIHSSVQPFFLSLTIPALYILLTILVVDILGFQLTIFTTIIGAFSVAAGLALSGTFQNFAGGVLILLLKPFEIDDYIVAQGQEGNVTLIQVFYTELLTPDNKTIIIPNGKLFNEVIVNISRRGTRRLDFEVKLAYATNVDKAKQAIQKVIAANSDVLSEPNLRVGVTGLEIDCIKFTISVWVEAGKFLPVKIALMENILKELAGAGIPFPKAG